MRFARRRPSAHSRRCAFTIIELLIVVAVLAILAAIIIPLLARARHASYRAMCVGNMRQFAAAFTLYAYDWNGFWPGPGGLYGDRGYWSQSGKGGLESYIRQRGIRSIWCCPLLREWHGEFPPRSYSMNSYLRTPPDIEYPSCVEYPYCLLYQSGINIGRLSEPGRTILLFEGMPLTNGWEDKLDYLYRCANWTKVRGHYDKVANTIDPGRPWHGRTNNYLYCDGHIVARAPYKYAGKLQASTEEGYQWYVDKARYRRLYMSGK